MITYPTQPGEMPDVVTFEDPFGYEDEEPSDLDEEFMRNATYEQALLQGPTDGFVPIHLILVPDSTNIFETILMAQEVDEWMWNLERLYSLKQLGG